MAYDYTKLNWADLIAQAQGDYNLQRSGGGFDANGVYRNTGVGDSFDYNSGGRTTVGGMPAQISFGGADPNSLDWNKATFNYNDPDGRKGYLRSLYRQDDGSVGMREYQSTGDMGFLSDMLKFAGTAAGMYGGVTALGGTAAPTGWIPAEGGTGYAGGMATDAAGGLFGTGLSTGSPFGDWLAKQGISTGLKAGIGSLIGGGTSPTRTGTNGGTGMADDFWGGLLGTGLTAGVLNNSGQRVSDAYNTSANNIMNLATSLKDTGKFTPYNISTGLGSVTTGPDGSIQATLDPKFQANSDLALNQSNYWLNQRANPLYAANEQKGLFGAGQLLDKAAAFDPEANAKTEYDLMQKIFAPTREQDNLDMENRLLQQGRLGLNYGSYGAAPELMALKQAQRMQDLNATKDSRQLAFERQNNMIGQAGALNDIGIKSGVAGTNQQKAYYDMADGLQQMSLRPLSMLQQQVGQSITAGANRSNAEQANARLFGEMGLNAEQTRARGTFLDAGLRNARDMALLDRVTGKGGAGGLLAGAGSALGGLAGGVGDLAKKLLGMGIPQDSLAQVMGQMGVDMDQFAPDGGVFDLSNLDFSDGFQQWQDYNPGFDADDLFNW